MHAICFGIGCLIGAIIVMLVFRTIIVGKLRVAMEPGENPYLFLEFTKDTNLENMSYAILKVDVNHYNSQQ